MIKKNIFFITSLLILAFNCSAKELKGNGNPKIGKIVRISSAKISSEHTETEIIPKYEIELESNTKYEINRSSELPAHKSFPNYKYLIPK